MGDLQAEPGLLSRAFKGPRTLSLSNLLDIGIEDIDKLIDKDANVAQAALADIAGIPGGVWWPGTLWVTH